MGPSASGVRNVARTHKGPSKYELEGPCGFPPRLPDRSGSRLANLTSVRRELVLVDLRLPDAVLPVRSLLRCSSRSRVRMEISSACEHVAQGLLSRIFRRVSSSPGCPQVRPWLSPAKPVSSTGCPLSRPHLDRLQVQHVDVMDELPSPFGGGAEPQLSGCRAVPHDEFGVEHLVAGP